MGSRTRGRESRHGTCSSFLTVQEKDPQGADQVADFKQERETVPFQSVIQLENTMPQAMDTESLERFENFKEGLAALSGLGHPSADVPKHVPPGSAETGRREISCCQLWSLPRQ